MKKSANLVVAAKISCALLLFYRLSPRANMNREKAVLISAQMTNYFFDEGIDLDRIKLLNMDYINLQSLAEEVLGSFYELRKLIVQGSRIDHVVVDFLSGKSKNITILQKYGHEFPDSPNLEAFEKFLYKISLSFSENEKMTVYGILKK